MKGVIVPQVGGAYEIVSNLIKPTPSPGQILVKSLATGINPVYESHSPTLLQYD